MLPPSFEDYAATNGFARFPDTQWRAIWQAVHKLLTKKDAEYRWFFRMNWGIMILVVAAMQVDVAARVSLLLPPGYAEVLGGFLQIVVHIAVCASLLGWFLLQYNYMNRRIAEELRSLSDAEVEALLQPRRAPNAPVH